MIRREEGMAYSESESARPAAQNSQHGFWSSTLVVMAAAADGPIEGMENQKWYIDTDVMVGPVKSVSYQWASYVQIPFREKLDDQGNVVEGVRRDLVQFISASGLPITLEPAPGKGAAAGGFEVVKEALGLLKMLKAAGEFVVEARRVARERKRRTHLPSAYIALNTNNATEVVVPLVAMLPDLVKHLSEKRPAMQFQFTIADGRNTIWTAPGVPITDGAVLKVLKRIEKGDRFIGVRHRTWKHWSAVKGFGESEYRPWAEFKMPPGMKSVEPPR